MPNGTDYVTHRELAEYVGREITEFHTIRAEALLMTRESLDEIRRGFRAHEQWHRDQLDKHLSARSSMTIAVIALILTFASIITEVALTLNHH